MTRQCPSCGGFCKKSGCERENAPIITSSDVIAGLEMALSQAEAMIERQQHVMQRAMAAWDTATHQKSGDGRLLQCMEELRAESHNADSLLRTFGNLRTGGQEMTDQEKRKSGGGKLTRTETVTVRLDPKLRYLAELAARKQRRTVSSFIEWAVEDSLGHLLLQEGNAYNNAPGVSIADESAYLWDVDEADRFARLALLYPDMLTHEEQVRWKLVRENGHLWRGEYEGAAREWTWTIEEGKLRFDQLRQYWDKFLAVARGEADKSTLPTWVKTKATSD